MTMELTDVFGVIDCETTGMDSDKDGVVEVAIVWTTIQGKCAEWSSLYNPGIPIPAGASAIHHIVDEDVKDRGTFDATAFFTGEVVDVAAYAAHNAEFDVKFLSPVPKPVICTMRLAQKLYPELESYGNQFLRYQLKLNPPIDRNASIHRALPDAIVTSTLLIHELKQVIANAKDRDSITIEKLVAWINEPMLLSLVRFGKHKGLKWSQVPKDYLRWLVNNMHDADRDTIHTAKFYLN